MARKVNEELLAKKKAVMDELFGFARAYAKHGMVRAERFYNELPEAKEIWRTRAYFIQQLKKFAPEDIEIIARQRKGTFLRLKSADNKLILRIENPVTGNVRELFGKVIDAIPSKAKKVSPSKWIKAIKEMENVDEVYKIKDGYIIKKGNEIVQFAQHSKTERGLIIPKDEKAPLPKTRRLRS